jgi:hypothetical protein
MLERAKSSYQHAHELEKMAVSFTVSACGGEGSGPVREHGTKPAPAKQESSGKAIEARLRVNLEERLYT